VPQRQVQGLAPGMTNQRAQCRLGSVQRGSSLAARDLGVLVDNKLNRRPALWVKTEGVWSFDSGEEKAHGGAYYSFPVLKGHLQRRLRVSSWGDTWRRQGATGTSCTGRGFISI